MNRSGSAPRCPRARRASRSPAPRLEAVLQHLGRVDQRAPQALRPSSARPAPLPGSSAPRAPGGGRRPGSRNFCRTDTTTRSGGAGVVGRAHGGSRRRRSRARPPLCGERDDLLELVDEEQDVEAPPGVGLELHAEEPRLLAGWGRPHRGRADRSAGSERRPDGRSPTAATSGGARARRARRAGAQAGTDDERVPRVAAPAERRDDAGAHQRGLARAPTSPRSPGAAAPRAGGPPAPGPSRPKSGPRRPPSATRAPRRSSPPRPRGRGSPPGARWPRARRESPAPRPAGRRWI